MASADGTVAEERMNFNVIVEVSQGWRNKYEMNDDTVRVLLAGYCSPPSATRPATGSSPARWRGRRPAQ